MKVLLLAAGYSRRLGNLTENTPKSLLMVGDKPLLNYLIEKLEKVTQITEVYLVTNSKYIKNFIEWKSTYKGRLNIYLLNDGTTCNEDRLGAIGDIILSLEHFKISDDLLISATDGFFEFDLTDFVNYFKTTKKNIVFGKRYADISQLSRFGVAELDENNKIINMEEKPEKPKSDIAVFATYLFKKDTLKLFYTYKALGKSMDSPGNFISWLYKVKDVYTYVFDDEFYDIGTVEVYNQVANKNN